MANTPKRGFPQPADGSHNWGAAVDAFILTADDALFDKGIYTALTVYKQGDLVLHSNGATYRALQPGTGNDPATSPTYWQAFTVTPALIGAVGTSDSRLSDATTATIGVVEIDVAPVSGHPIAATKPTTDIIAANVATNTTNIASNTTAIAGKLTTANNLSDVPTPATARTNLGLGSAATASTSAFDASGAAATAQANSLQKASNLFDVASASTALSNLGGVATGDSRLSDARTPTAHKTTHASGGTDALDYTLVNLVGLFSAIPVAATANNGLTYYATDTQHFYRSNGSAWVLVAKGVTDTATPTAHASTHITGASDPVQLATDSVDGLMAHADHTQLTANTSKLSTLPSSVTGTAPVAVSGAGAVSMAAATDSVSGYLTSTDHTTYTGYAASIAGKLSSGDASVTNARQGQIPYGIFASRPGSATDQTLYYATDVGVIYQYESSAWVALPTGVVAGTLTTTDATQTEITISSQSYTRIVVTTNAGKVAYFLVKGVDTAGNTGAWQASGVINRAAANAAISGFAVYPVAGTTPPATWGTPAITVDTTLQAIVIKVTGVAATTIAWTLNVQWT